MPKEERTFSISGNNKGLTCPFKPILCQEGYCKACQIYLDWQKLGEMVVMTKGEAEYNNAFLSKGKVFPL